jgi:precorrin-2 dehydrogenase/sirohydrochlorin ferrochelatase
VKQKSTPAEQTFIPESYYPAFLNLNKKKAVVCGGGNVAERKVAALLKTGAKITVISPKITVRLEREKRKGTIKHLKRNYRKGDLNNAFIVIGATDSQEINKRIARDAPYLVNIVDTPELCNFIVPSVVKRGHLTIAISTGGISPALSRSIRLEYEKHFSSEFAMYLKLLKAIRQKAKMYVLDKTKRRRLLKEIASEEMIKILRAKGCKEAGRVMNRLFTESRDI